MTFLLLFLLDLLCGIVAYRWLIRSLTTDESYTSEPYLTNGKRLKLLVVSLIGGILTLVLLLIIEGVIAFSKLTEEPVQRFKVWCDRSDSRWL